MNKYIKNGYNCLRNCGSKTSREGQRCKSCAQKERFKIKENHPMFGYHFSKESIEKIKFIDGRTLKNYYCECGNEVDYNGSGKCQSCSLKGRKLKDIHKPDCTCSFCMAYIDGRTNLIKSIRNSMEYVYWRNEVFKRDNYICQDCFKRGSGNLNAHHTKRFSIIFDEFLRKYDRFSPIEDKETLLKLALDYEPFWDTGNGETLCEDCHKSNTPYGRNIDVENR